ncbi:MAG: hypothetical protein J5I53_10990 [Bradyrhizobiaceae bacterium]|nr:hypothetical protein [Bradyrhizobiaceae bacterium]
MQKIQSTNPEDYEILIRRRDQNDYASYCPQLTHMIKGREHEEVEEAMKEYILAYIAQLNVASQSHEE